MSTPPRRLKTNRETPEAAPSRQISSPTTAVTHQRRYKDCRYCDKEHPLRKCFRFRRLPVQERLKIVRRFGYCFNCLAHSHLMKNCRSRDRCKICLNEHHTLLHRERETRPIQRKTPAQTTGNKQKRRSSPQRSQQAYGPVRTEVSTSTNGAPTIVINVTSKP